MATANTTTRYGSITRVFHWLTALLIMTLIPVAMIAHELPYDTSEQLGQKAWLYSLHKTLGIAVFFVALLRILWAVSQPKPASLHPERKMENFLAETAHWLLYGSLVLAPLSGWIHHAATSGFAPIWWPLGQNLPLVAKSESVSALFGGLHWVFGKVMIVSLLLHIAGALKHHFIDIDATLRRMLNGAPELADLPATQHGRSSLVAALAIWGMVLTGAGTFGLYTPKAGAVEAAALADVPSDWVVQDGSIAIEVTQFGATVEGQFTDWTAQISFDPQVQGDVSGQVEAVISIGSLTLGSVTDQAMGPDFFDAARYETATFKADIITGIDGYLAEGTLSIKDVTIPVSMRFSMSLVDEDAEVSAQLSLDRMDFGIGANMPDESSLAFAVKVLIDLNATKATPE